MKLIDTSDPVAREAARRRQDRWHHILRTAIALLGLAVLVGVIAIDLNTCEAPADDATGALRSQGLRWIELGDVAPGRCESGETSRSFTAINARGDRVGGIVCCGLVAKGCTVRW